MKNHPPRKKSDALSPKAGRDLSARSTPTVLDYILPRKHAEIAQRFANLIAAIHLGEERRDSWRGCGSFHAR
jgi:hypothetical protein